MTNLNLIASILTLVGCLGIYVGSTTEKGKAFCTHFFRPQKMLRAPVILPALYVLYCAGTSSVESNTLVIGLYLFIPTILVCLASYFSREDFSFDLLAALFLYVMVDFRLLPTRHHACCEGKLLDWGLWANFAAVLAIVFWAVARKNFVDLKVSWTWRWKDAGIFCLAFLLLAPTIIVLGVKSGFLLPMDFDQSIGTQILNGVKRTFSGKFVGQFAQYWVSVAPQEEFLFRGVLQGWLTERWREKKHGTWLAIVVTALVFGAFHFNNSSHGFKDVSLTNWNWQYMTFATYAGLFYGALFHYTKSIWWVITLHAFVDAQGRINFMK